MKSYFGLEKVYGNLSYFGYLSNDSNYRTISDKIRNLNLSNIDQFERHLFVAGNLFWSGWDWKSAEKEYRYAIADNPKNVDARYEYSCFLDAQCRFQEAVGELEIAEKIDPLNPQLKIGIGWALMKRGEYDKSLRICQKAKHLDANYWAIHELIGVNLYRKGLKSEGISELEEAVRLDSGPIQLARLGRMYGQNDRKHDANNILLRLKEMKVTKNIPAHYIALVYEGIEKYKLANEWIIIAINNRESSLVYLKSEIDDLNRRNPYFPQWLKKIGLDQLPDPR